MANHGDLSPPGDGGSQMIPVIYQSPHSMTPGGPPCSLFLYYRPLPPQRHVDLDGATKVLCLSQMVSVDELGDAGYYGKVYMKIVTEEGHRSGGKLLRTVVPRPHPSGAPVAGLGKVFLEYADINSSAYSRTMLHGMWFLGRQVIAEFYPEDKFADGDYDA